VNDPIIGRHILGDFKNTENLSLFQAHRAFLPHGEVCFQFIVSGSPGNPEEQRLVDTQPRHGLFLHRPLKIRADVSLCPYPFLVRTVREYLFRVVNVDLLHGKPVDRVAHHLVQAVVLTRAAEPNLPLGDQGRQRELKKHLVIQVLGDEERVLLAFVHQDRPAPLRDETRNQHSADNDHHQAGYRNVLDQLERLDGFKGPSFVVDRRHGHSV